jgi:NAD(P)-dependent dehydrogenase (short-subunit alcohol dehydrogenase family)
MPLFENRVVLITGGSSGIGRATALAFAREGAGIAIAARGSERAQTVVQEVEAAGARCVYIPADLSRSEDVGRMVRETVNLFGRLDFAFNNAASVEGIFTATADLTEEQYDRAMAVNLKAVWLGMKFQIQQMLKQERPGGAIVNTSSLNGLGGARMASLYSAAKAGVIAFTKAAAQEYATRNIRINALVAGGYRTPMLEGIIDRHSGGDPAQRVAVEAQYTSMIPMARIGDPTEAAAAVLWLCSPGASYVTGHSMIVDGGWSCSLR